MEIEVPDNDVLLSDFSNWHCVLNGGPLSDWKKIFKEIEWQDKEAGRVLKFAEYPEDIQKEIVKSWEAVFDLDRRDKELGRTHKRNRSIQATLWILKKEYIISVELLERRGDVIKPIRNYPYKDMQV